MKNLSKRIAELSSQQRRVLELRLKKENLNSPKTQAISKRKESSPCVLSPNQEWLWSVDQLTNGNPAWNVFTGGHFSGPLNVAVLNQSLNEIIKRHEVLRTTLPVIDGQPVQAIAPSLELELPIVDLQEIPEADRATVAQQWIAERYRQLFDLAKGPLVRPTLFRLGEEEHQLLVVMHHTITDWVSFILLNKELVALYQAFSDGKPSPLPELPIQYADYALWEREWVESETAQAQLAYWKQQLERTPAALKLPLNQSRPAVQTFWGARYPLVLSGELSQALRFLSQHEGVTMFITVLTVLNMLLYRYMGQENIVVGTPVIGRKPRETENLIGLFLNHLALRTDISGNPSFRELLGRVRKTVLEGYAHQELPFGKLVQEILPQRDVSRNPLFQVMFFFLSVPSIQKFSDLTLQNFEAYGGTSRYDLSISLWDKADAVGGFFEYNTDLFDSATIAQMIGHFQTLLEDVVANLERPLSDLIYLLDSNPVQ